MYCLLIIIFWCIEQQFKVVVIPIRPHGKLIDANYIQIIEVKLYLIVLKLQANIYVIMITII